MPEFLHLSSVFHEGLKALGDRMTISLIHMKVTKSLDQVKADPQRPAHHLFNQIEQGMSEHLTPDLQLSVMQACNIAYVQAMQQSRYFQQTVAAYPPVPSLSRLTSMPTSAAYHCMATSIPSIAGHQYSTTTMPSAVGQPTTTTMTTVAPSWTSSTDTMMQQQDPGMAFRTATTTMQQQDPGMAFRTATTTMQQDYGMAFRSTSAMDSGMAFRSMSTMDSGMAACSMSTMDSGMAARSMSTMDSGMAARSTSTMDSGMAAFSTSTIDSGTVQPDPDRSSITTMPRHMSPPRLPRTRRSQKGRKNKKQRTISIPPPSPPSVSVMSGLSHPSSASQASHVSSPIPNYQTPQVSLPFSYHPCVVHT
ncbi:mucin-13-like isoform X1 [Ranitomeya imitator]|uniref:mucin-13-like isoform X1 n=1 Tax=Ranitomeya imitator TaxID=111125 RepID=UPI0037E8DCD6